jgi:hypothetical protein
LISVQSLCSGWGSDVISCVRESLFTNVTWVPRGTVMFCGQTALFEIVMVVDMELAVHVLPVDGPVLGLEPQASEKLATAANTAAAAAFLV